MQEVNLTLAIDDLIAILPAVSAVQGIDAYIDQPLHVAWQNGWLTTNFHCPDRPYGHIGTIRADGDGYPFPFKLLLVTRILAFCAQRKRQDRSIDRFVIHARLKEPGDGSSIYPVGYSIGQGAKTERVAFELSWAYKATRSVSDSATFMERVARFYSVERVKILRRADVWQRTSFSDAAHTLVRALPGEMFEVFNMEYQPWIKGSAMGPHINVVKLLRTVGQTPTQTLRI